MDDHALDTLKYIRESMESASALTVPGTAGLLMGAVGVVTFAVAQIQFLQPHWLAIWLLGALFALVLGGGSMLRQARRHGRTLYSGPARKFLLCLLPALIVGALLTPLFVQHGLEQYLAGTWLLLYGCAVLSASAMTSALTLRLIASMGSLFMLLGVAAFELPVNMHNVVLGLGFGGLHLLFGTLIRRVNHAK